MEKISGIIPGNKRTKTSELSKSQPVRPGAPAFGRAIGKVTSRDQILNDMSDIRDDKPQIEDRLELSDEIRFREIPKSNEDLTSSTINAQSSLRTYKPSKDAEKVKIIEGISRKFLAKEEPVIAQGEDQI